MGHHVGRHQVVKSVLSLRVPNSENHAPDHWFQPIAEHLGAAYLRYSFTKGTVQEVDHIVGALQLEPGERVLDVGCGPGRHAHELARRGIAVHGVDISERFVELAREHAPRGRRSSGSTPGRSRSTASSTPRSACARARSG